MSRRCIAPAFHSAPTRRLSRLSLPVEWDFKSMKALMKDVKSVECGRNGQTLRCVVCFTRKKIWAAVFRHASAMSSPIFLIAIFLEQRADITRALSRRERLTTVRHIVAQRHGLAARFLFSKMAVDFPLLGFRAYYQAETKSADLATGAKKINIEVGNFSSHAFLMRFVCFSSHQIKVFQDPPQATENSPALLIRFL